MMLPPVDEQVLRDNPEFSKLYSTLKNDILNSDGSTNLNPDVKECEAVHQVRQLDTIFLSRSAMTSAITPVNFRRINEDESHKKQLDYQM